MPSDFFLISGGQLSSVEPDQATQDSLRSDPLEVVTLNVGDGEAIIVRRKRLALIIDGGAVVKKENKVLGKVLLSYLRNEGLRLRGILASHPHTDHLNALATLLREGGKALLAPAAKYFDNNEAYPNWLQQTLIPELAALQDRLEVVHVGESAVLFSMGIDVRATLFADGRYKPTPAYRSVFMAMRFRGLRFLFTGDAYTDYEESLMASSHAQSLPAHFLKITHHGSSGGSGAPFLQKVRPLISYGSTSSDDSHELESDVRKRLKQFGEVYDTATVGGDITLRVDGVPRVVDGKQGVLVEVERLAPGRFL